MSERPTISAGMEVTPTVRLVSALGEGGMGAVWLADHTGLKTRVVVKFMLGELGASSHARARFSREAAAAAQVKSPHVVQMFDHGVTDEGVPFIVMEYLEGRDLGAKIAETGPLAPAEVVSIVGQVGKALSKVHAAGLLHRDIKPDNIFLCDGDDDEPFVKLLDFGIVKTSASAEGEESTLDGSTKTGQIVGTPFYMSPEQVTAQKSIDLRSDLWALGVVTFEALTATRPFDGPSFGALAVKIATGEIPIPSSVNPALPPAFDAWFARACAREADRRFASAKELVDGLRAAFDGVVSLPPSLEDSGRRSDGARVLTPGRGSSPSFELASTLEQPDASSPPALARSESEGASVPIEPDSSTEHRRRGLPRGVLPILGIVVVALAGGGYVLGRTSGDTPDATSARPSARETSAPAPREAPSAAALTAAPDAAVDAARDVPEAGADEPEPKPAAAAARPSRAVPTRRAKPAATRKAAKKPAASASAAPAASVSAPPTVTKPPMHDDPLF